MGGADPDLLGASVRWLKEYLPSVYSGAAALGISGLMGIRDSKPKKLIITGSCVCGIFALTLSGVLEHFGLPGNGAAFAGAAVGFVGADKIRDTILAMVARKTGEDKHDENQQ
jgi:lambda family phage holin